MRKLYISFAILVIVGVAAIYVLFGINDSEQTVAPRVEKPLYVALGDSVSAGYGLYTASDSTSCYRYVESYPNVVAKKLGFDMKNLSCSGATIREGILGVQTIGTTSVDPQIDSLTGAEKYVSVTVGANDVGWSSFIQKCFVGLCGTPEDTMQANAKRETLGQEIVTMLNKLRTIVPTTTTITITGYYQVVSSNIETCTAVLPLTENELTWMFDQTNLLNDTIRNSTRTVSSVRFAEVNFEGHDLCTSEPWVQGLTERAPFHPTEDGQKAIGEVVARSFSN